MPPRGDHDRNAMSISSATSISGSLVRNLGEYSFCTATRSSPRISRATRICSGFALEMPAIWTFPACTSSLTAPIATS